MQPELIFRPLPTRHQKASRLPAVNMAFITIDQSLRLLLAAGFKHASLDVADQHIDRYAKRLLAASHTTLFAVGREHITRGKSYVFMSNHQSWLDIPTLICAIPGSVRLVAKNELFQIPIWGPAMERSGFIRLDRKNRTKAIAQLEKAKERLNEGLSLWISPEGTRNRSGADDLRPFKKGGFHVACELETPIIPVWIDGASQVMAPDSALVHTNRNVVVYFGQPITTSLKDKSDLDPLMARVRSAILALRPARDTTPFTQMLPPG